MGSVIGDILPMALGVAISPVPIIAVILMLLAPRARAASLAFMLGWVVGVVVVVAAVTFLVQPAGSSDPEDPSLVASLDQARPRSPHVVLGIREWRGRPKDGEEPSAAVLDGRHRPGDGTEGRRSRCAAVGREPEEPRALRGRRRDDRGADLSTSDTLVSVAVFVALASSTVVIPVLAYLVAHDRMQEPLDELRRWLTVNNATVMSVLLLVIGVVILGKGIGGL